MKKIYDGRILQVTCILYENYLYYKLINELKLNTKLIADKTCSQFINFQNDYS